MIEIVKKITCSRCKHAEYFETEENPFECDWYYDPSEGEDLCDACWTERYNNREDV